jgi:hypothetical protein
VPCGMVSAVRVNDAYASLGMVSGETLVMTRLRPTEQGLKYETRDSQARQRQIGKNELWPWCSTTRSMRKLC